MKIVNYYFFIIALLFVLLLQVSCSNTETLGVDQINTKDTLDLPYVLKKKKLTVLFENSILSYFNYKGKEMGFEYELMSEFAKHLGVELDVQLLDNKDSLLSYLNTGAVDVIACNYALTRDRSKMMSFSTPFSKSPQVLVQRRPDNWSTLSAEKKVTALITDPIQLADKKIHVWKNSSYFQRLIHLQEEIGDSIKIIPQDGDIGTEELIEMVADGEIDYTISEQNLALLNQRFYDNIDVSVHVSIKQNIVFGVRKESALLLAAMNEWLYEFMKGEKFSYIKSKYFDLKYIASDPDELIATVIGGRLSDYDDLFKKYGKKYGIDWRILASISFQESRFNPKARGLGGAFGLMQFMPATGRKYGINSGSSADKQIEAAAKLLSNTIREFSSIPDSLQRYKFVLASYNSGQSHVEDAQRLAKKHKKNPQIWDGNVKVMFKNLSKRKYFADRVVRNGAARGWHTCNYVDKIFNRYEIWRKMADD
jgi:membrane-bound lytic murein transglycosylase F